MTFEEFQATRKWSDDIATAIGSAQWGDDGTACGQIYAGSLYIESALHIDSATGKYVLTIGNVQKFGDLEALERDLYDFAQSEGYLED